MTGKFFEELSIEDKFITQARTVTETDIVLFAGLSGDYSLPHTNDEWCKKTRFGAKIAHGLLIASIASGLFTRTGLFEETGLAHLGTTMKFTAPVYAGDTVHVEFTIMGKEEMDVNRGRLAIRLEGINQNGKMVYQEDMKSMIARKPVS